MFTENIYYGLRCDRCLKHYFSDEDYNDFASKDEVLENAIEDGWIKYAQPRMRAMRAIQSHLSRL